MFLIRMVNDTALFESIKLNKIGYYMTIGFIFILAILILFRTFPAFCERFGIEIDIVCVVSGLPQNKCLKLFLKAFL